MCLTRLHIAINNFPFPIASNTMMDDENSGPWVILDGRGMAVAEWSIALQQIQQSIPAPLHPTVWQLGNSSDGFGPSRFPVKTPSDVLARLERSPCPWIGYVPLSAGSIAPLPLPNPDLTTAHPFLAAWVTAPNFPEETADAASPAISSWIASPDLVLRALQASTTLPQTTPWSLLALADVLEAASVFFGWRVVAGDQDGKTRGDRPLPDNKTVLAIVPHYHCEPWLHRCLTSLVNQSRPLDNIVVVDDGSPYPPTEIVSAFPEVTLLASPRTVGPYRLVQQVIETTAYSHYLFQDADDWSSCDRLATLLQTAEAAAADLVGTQELRIETEHATLVPVHYPLEVNQALTQKPGHPLLHPTSLVRRSLVEAVGGFATGLRFGGDTEFLLRAAFVGRIVNSPNYGYFRQKRPHSLTTNPQTGLGSPARQVLLAELKQRFRANKAAVQTGKPCHLAPLSRSPAVPLIHHAGPTLKPSAVKP